MTGVISIAVHWKGLRVFSKSIMHMVMLLRIRYIWSNLLCEVNGRRYQNHFHTFNYFLKIIGYGYYLFSNRSCKFTRYYNALHRSIKTNIIYISIELIMVKLKHFRAFIPLRQSIIVMLCLIELIRWICEALDWLGILLQLCGLYSNCFSN